MCVTNDGLFGFSHGVPMMVCSNFPMVSQPPVTMLEPKQCPSPDSREPYPEGLPRAKQSPATMLEPKQCPSPDSGEPFPEGLPRAKDRDRQGPDRDPRSRFGPRLGAQIGTPRAQIRTPRAQIGTSPRPKSGPRGPNRDPGTQTTKPSAVSSEWGLLDTNRRRRGRRRS